MSKKIVLVLVAMFSSGALAAKADDFCYSSDERHVVRLVRQGAIGGAMTTYRVLVDDKKVGTVKGGDSVDFSLPGDRRYEIRVANSLWGGTSNVLRVRGMHCGHTVISCSTALLGKITCREKKSKILPKVTFERGPAISRRLAVESVTINNCHSTTVAYDTRSLKQEASHIARFDGELKISGRGVLWIPGVGSLNAGAEIGLAYGEEYGSTIEWGREIQVSADPGQHVVHYFVIKEILEKGVLHYGLRRSARFSYLKNIDVELHDTQYLPCD